MDQSLDPLLELDERTVVRDRDDLSADTSTDRVLLVDVGPGIRHELLQPQRDALAVPIDIQHLHVDHRPDVHDLAWVTNSAPRHVGDVQESVEPTQIEERAEVGHVLDRAFADLPNEELLDQRLALSLALSLEDHPTRHDDIPPALVEFDDLELEGLSQEIFDVRHSPQSDLRARQKRVDTHDVDRDATLDLAGKHTLDGLVRLVGLADSLPHP